MEVCSNQKHISEEMVKQMFLQTHESRKAIISKRKLQEIKKVSKQKRHDTRENSRPAQRNEELGKQ